MNLKHFSPSDCSSEKALNRKYRALAQVLHPDKVPEPAREAQRMIFQEMKNEYEHLKINRTAYKEPTFNGKFRRAGWNVNPDADADALAKHQAQKLFHSITNLNNVDVNLLVASIKEVNDWPRVVTQFTKSYGIEVVPLILSKVKDDATRGKIFALLMQIQSGKESLNTIFGLANSIKNLFKKN